MRLDGGVLQHADVSLFFCFDCSRKNTVWKTLIYLLTIKKTKNSQVDPTFFTIAHRALPYKTRLKSLSVNQHQQYQHKSLCSNDTLGPHVPNKDVFVLDILIDNDACSNFHRVPFVAFCPPKFTKATGVTRILDPKNERDEIYGCSTFKI